MLSELELINKAKKGNSWDFGNKLLYDLCKNNFLHNVDQIILTKVLFIGHIYAAAVERRSENLKLINDEFYLEKVIPSFLNSKLDNLLIGLKLFERITELNMKEILEAHYYLLKELHDITGKEKRSFCSKYLHFHLPHLYFIYDSRAVSALNYLSKDFKCKTPQNLITDRVDKVYTSYFYKCFEYKKHLEEKYKVQLDNRQFDIILMYQANQMNSPKKKKSKRKTNNNSENS